MQQNHNKIIWAAILNCLCLLPLTSGAQQLGFNNQYLMNKFSISPAYAGMNGNMEAFATYKKSWTGIQGAPEMQQVNFNGSVRNNMGLGGNIINEKTGIFKYFSASLDYAYYIKFSETHFISVGVGPEIQNHSIELPVKSQNQADPVISSQDINKTNFNANAGILYHFRNLSIGAVSQRLLENKIEEVVSGNKIFYTLKRHYITHISYLYEINGNWQMEPCIVARETDNSPVFYEIAVPVKYQKTVWLGITYRKNNSIGITAGSVLYKKAAISYTYDFGGGGMQAKSSGTHEISIGLLIGKNKNGSSSIFSVPQQPYYQFNN